MFAFSVIASEAKQSFFIKIASPDKSGLAMTVDIRFNQNQIATKTVEFPRYEVYY
jgi:hypothetical protein